MKYNIIIAILICVILFILYKYIQAKQIISDKKGEIKTSEALFNFILQHIKSYILVIDRNFIVEKTNYYAITDTEDSGQPKRVGELLNCVNSLNKGCGNGELCKACPIRQAVTEAFKTKKDFSNLETTVSLRLSDKKTFKCNVAVSGSYMNIHNRPEMLITIHDITELKQAQIRLQDALAKTERIEKSKFTFLEKLSNEINDQLNCILGWTNLVSTDKTLTPNQQNEYMNLIYERVTAGPDRHAQDRFADDNLLPARVLSGYYPSSNEQHPPERGIVFGRRHPESLGVHGSTKIISGNTQSPVQRPEIHEQRTHQTRLFRG